MLSRFHLIPERYGRTDGRTDGQICYINTALLTRDKNRDFRPISHFILEMMQDMAMVTMKRP